jgi:hypothetical protein
MSDQQAADAINAKTVVVRSPVPADKVQETASVNGLWGALKMAALDSTLTNPPRGAAIAFIDWVESGRPLNPDNPAVQQMAGTLIQHSLATVAQINQINDLANQQSDGSTPKASASGIGYAFNARKAIAGVIMPSNLNTNYSSQETITAAVASLASDTNLLAGL